MRRRQSLRNRHARRSRIHVVRRLRPAHLNFVRRVRIARLQLRAVHLHRPLEIRILVHLVRPHRRIQLEPANNRNHFLPVRHAPHAGNQRHSHARRRLEMLGPKRRPAVPANHRRQQPSSTGFSLCAFDWSFVQHRARLRRSLQPGLQTRAIVHAALRDLPCPRPARRIPAGSHPAPSS